MELAQYTQYNDKIMCETNLNKIRQTFFLNVFQFNIT